MADSTPYVLKMPLATSTSPPAKPKSKHEWLVILPDHEGVLERRMGVRPQHLRNLDAKVEQGFWTLGGALLDEPLSDGSGPKIKGSVMLATADTREEVVEELKGDVYFKERVWDWEKVTIMPFKSMIRKEL